MQYVLKFSKQINVEMNIYATHFYTLSFPFLKIL